LKTPYEQDLGPVTSISCYLCSFSTTQCVHALCVHAVKCKHNQKPQVTGYIFPEFKHFI